VFENAGIRCALEKLMNGHRLIEERSLWLHRAVADKARHDPDVLSRARERVEGWLVDRTVHPRYAEAWQRLLSSELEEVLRRLVDPGETMCALRQCSPFAGSLAPKERWRILREAREARSQ
jgi:hypothetical protein